MTPARSAAPKSEPPRGVLARRAAPPGFRHARYHPSASLAPLVEHHWVVAWDLRGRPPHVQRTLPFPSVHWVTEPEGSFVYGVPEGRFTRVLEGEGRVLGVKFRPGVFRALARRPVIELTGLVLPAQEVFGPGVVELARALREIPDSRSCDDARVAAAESFLVALRPTLDDAAVLVRDLVERVAVDRSIVRVDALAAHAGARPRTLQRLFREHVGVSPKWVIRRFRLHEAVERADAGERVDWAALALDLGYSDQPHFVRDFKALVGRTPATYARDARR